MPRRALLGSTTLAARFPGVMRLLGGVSADDQRDHGDEDDNQDGEGQGDDNDGDQTQTETEDGDQTDDGGDSGGRQVDEDDEGQGGAGGAAAASIAAGITGEERVRLLSAFETDANRLVAAERDRCIAVFTSDAGRANPDGAAACLAEGLTSDRSIALLGTVSGRSLARNRLNGDQSTRVRTGAGREGRDDQAQDERAAHKARRDKRNKQAAAKGGKKPLDATSDD